MAVFRRPTTCGETKEYHYNFMFHGRRYYGVCENCTTERAATEYERKIKETLKKAAEQKNITAFVENFRVELTGAQPLTVADAFSAYSIQPAKRPASTHQLSVLKSYWTDFAEWLASNHPETINMSAVTDQQAKEYITYLRINGVYNKRINYSAPIGKQGKVKNVTYIKNGTLSSRTINARHICLKSVFSRLAGYCGLIKNPFDFPQLAADTAKRDIFTPEELTLIGDNMTMPYIKPIFLAFFCVHSTTHRPSLAGLAKRTYPGA